MRFKKEEPELHAVFAFESDDDWDYKEVQKYILDLPHNSEYKSTLNEKQIESFHKVGNYENGAYSAYSKNGFDPDYIKGNPLLLTFSSFNINDLKIVSAKHKDFDFLFKSVSEGADLRSTSANDILNKIFADKKLTEKFKLLITDVLDAKVVSVENTDMDRKEMLEHIVNNATIADLINLWKFIKNLNMNNIIKKKVLKLSAV